MVKSNKNTRHIDTITFWGKGEADMIDFNTITYEFLKPEYPCDKYSLEELLNHGKNKSEDNSRTEYLDRNNAKVRFLTARDDLQKDFKDICRMFQVEFFLEELKHSGRFGFEESDLSFIIEILKKYRTNKIWRNYLKKVRNYQENRFYNLFLESECSMEFVDELEFAVDGFCRLYSNNVESVNKREVFREAIHISTQLNLIDWVCRMRNGVSVIPQLLQKDVENTISGVLLKDYNDWLKRMQDKTIELWTAFHVQWFEIVLNRKMEYEKMLEESSEEIDRFVGAIQKKIDQRILDEVKETKSKRTNEQGMRKRSDESKKAQIAREEILNAMEKNPVLALEAYKLLIPEEIKYI